MSKKHKINEFIRNLNAFGKRLAEDPSTLQEAEIDAFLAFDGLGIRRDLEFWNASFMFWRRLIKVHCIDFLVDHYNKAPFPIKSGKAFDEERATHSLRAGIAVTSFWLRKCYSQHGLIPEDFIPDILTSLLRVLILPLSGVDWDKKKLTYAQFEAQNFLLAAPVVEHLLETITLVFPLSIASQFFRFLSISLLRLMKAHAVVDREYAVNSDLTDSWPIGENLFFLSRSKLCLVSLVHWISMADADPWQFVRSFADSLSKLPATVDSESQTAYCMRENLSKILFESCSQFSKVYAYKPKASQIRMKCMLFAVFDELKKGANKATMPVHFPYEVPIELQQAFQEHNDAGDPVDAGLALKALHPASNQKGFFTFESPYPFALVLLASISEKLALDTSSQDIECMIFSEDLMYFIMTGNPTQDSLIVLRRYFDIIQTSSDRLSFAALFLHSILFLLHEEQSLFSIAYREQGFSNALAHLIQDLLLLIKAQLEQRYCPHLFSTSPYRLTHYLFLKDLVDAQADVRLVSVVDSLSLSSHIFDVILHLLLAVMNLKFPVALRYFVPEVGYSLLKRALSQTKGLSIISADFLPKKLLKICQILNTMRTNIVPFSDDNLVASGLLIRLIPCMHLVFQVSDEFALCVDFVEQLSSVKVVELMNYIGKLSVHESKEYSLHLISMIEKLLENVESSRQNAQLVGNAVPDETNIAHLKLCILVYEFLEKSLVLFSNHSAFNEVAGRVIALCYLFDYDFEISCSILLNSGSTELKRAFVSRLLNQIEVAAKTADPCLEQIFHVLPQILVGLKKEKINQDIKKCLPRMKEYWMSTSGARAEVPSKQCADSLSSHLGLFLVQYILYSTLAKLDHLTILPPHCSESVSMSRFIVAEQTIESIRIELILKEGHGVDLAKRVAFFLNKFSHIFASLDCFHSASEVSHDRGERIILSVEYVQGYFTSADFNLMRMIQYINDVVCDRVSQVVSLTTVASDVARGSSQQEQYDKLVSQIRESVAGWKDDYSIGSKFYRELQGLIRHYEAFSLSLLKNPISRFDFNDLLEKMRSWIIRLAPSVEVIQSQLDRITLFLNAGLRLDEPIADKMMRAEVVLQDLNQARSLLQDKYGMMIREHQGKLNILILDAQKRLGEFNSECEKTRRKQEKEHAESLRKAAHRGAVRERKPQKEAPVKAVVENRVVTPGILRIVEEPNRFAEHKKSDQKTLAAVDPILESRSPATECSSAPHGLSLSEANISSEPTAQDAVPSGGDLDAAWSQYAHIEHYISLLLEDPDSAALSGHVMPPQDWVVLSAEREDGPLLTGDCNGAFKPIATQLSADALSFSPSDPSGTSHHQPDHLDSEKAGVQRSGFSRGVFVFGAHLGELLPDFSIWEPLPDEAAILR